MRDAVRILILIYIYCGVISTTAQKDCDPVMNPALSSRIANYEIDAQLDTRSKTITASERLTWTNPSNESVDELRFYMYINAFKNTESTFLREADNLFGRNFKERKEEEWGFLEVNSMRWDSMDLTPDMRYIHPDDGNTNDQTVLSVPLNRAVAPGETITLDLNFTAKLPLLLVRTGYSRDDFYHVVHWFPQIGVYEKDREGEWGWNCHQFHRRTEFYSNFGTYRVRITAPDHLTIDGTGCRVEESLPEAGLQVVEYYAEDVIDFAWVAYPYFESFEDEWNGVQIRLHTAEEHGNLAPRFLEAVKAALSYMDEHVGPYPYPSITMMDPPIHALSSGFMEYPTYITIGSFRYFPRGVRTIESLVIHEFVHQYFMGMVASNEKEEPWLDEGFVTYFEDRIMEETYGENHSMFDLYGYKVGSSQWTRSEYTDLPDPGVGPVSQPGWEIKTSYKGLVYSKAATVLKTMEGMLGREVMDRIIQTYFERWKFKHPRGEDFREVVREVVSTSARPGALGGVDRFFDQLIHGTGICDYAVTDISNEEVWSKAGLFDVQDAIAFIEAKKEKEWEGRITLRRLGEVILPVEVEIEYENGQKELVTWKGEERYLVLKQSGRVVACTIDPERKLTMDINVVNNSYTLDKDPWPVRKIGVKSFHWIQNLLQSLAFII